VLPRSKPNYPVGCWVPFLYVGSVVSGKASLETSYRYALFARIYGHNNPPDSSNMCHETTSVALKLVGSLGRAVSDAGDRARLKDRCAVDVLCG
jgi:hypothetical protein